MNWLPLEHLLLEAHPGRAVTADLDHAQLRQHALQLAAELGADYRHIDSLPTLAGSLETAL